MILVTGFGPFLNHAVNPSELLIQDLAQSRSFEGQVETLILPVSFEESFVQLKNQIMQFHDRCGVEYKALLMLGLASGRRNISVERVALNWCESEQNDNKGYRPVRGSIDIERDAAFFTSLQPEKLVEDLSRLEIPAEVSLSAGGYVCNYIYFKALSELKIPSLFVHFPDLHRDDEELKSKPSLKFVVMQSGLKRLIQHLI